MGESFVSERAAPVPPAITNNSESKFVIVWGDGSGGGLIGALFDLKGEPISGEFAVSSPGASSATFPAAAHMVGPKPGFAVAWIEEGQPRVILRRFKPDGQPLGAPFRVSESLPEPDFGPTVARSPDANSIVCWAGTDGNIHAMAFDVEGKSRGPEFKVSPEDGFHTGPVRVVGLENNSFAVCWVGGQFFGSSSPMFQVLQPTGERIDDAKTLDLSGFVGDFGIAQIVNPVFAAEPHFALAHATSPLLNGQRILEGAFFGPSGDLLLENPPFNITHTDENKIAGHPALTALPNHRFLVTWSEKLLPELGDTTGENIRAMVCAEGSDPSSDPIDVSVGIGNQQTPGVAFALGEDGSAGAVAVVWMDDSISGADAATRTIKVRTL